MRTRLFFSVPVLLAALALVQAQTPSGKLKSDIELVERLQNARKEYQASLEKLRSHYLRVGDLERARWAEEELIKYHRIPKRAFRLDLFVPSPKLKASTNIPEANRLYTLAMQYKGRGWGTDYIDNQRRAELLLQKLLNEYPESNKISDAAYQLGDIYESKAYRQYRRAALYFERCYQWNSATQFDARLRAARIYDRTLRERGKALDIYKLVEEYETDPNRLSEAKKRIADLSTSP